MADVVPRKIQNSLQVRKAPKTYLKHLWEKSLPDSSMPSIDRYASLLMPSFVYPSGIFYHSTDVLLVGNNSILNAVISMLLLRKNVRVSILGTREYNSNIGLYRITEKKEMLSLVYRIFYGSFVYLEKEKILSIDKHVERISSEMSKLLSVSTGSISFVDAPNRSAFQKHNSSLTNLQTADLKTSDRKHSIEHDWSSVYSDIFASSNVITFPDIPRTKNWNPNPDNAFIEAEHVIVTDTFYDGYLPNAMHAFPFLSETAGYEHKGKKFLTNFCEGLINLKDYIDSIEKKKGYIDI